MESCHAFCYDAVHEAIESVNANKSVKFAPKAASSPVPGQIKNRFPRYSGGKPTSRDRSLRFLSRASRRYTDKNPVVVEPQIAPALSRLQRLLNGAARKLQTKINFALIGGLSLAAWGVVRATQDIDLLADSEPSPISDVKLRTGLKSYFERQRWQVEWRVGDYDDPIPLLLRIELPRAYGRLGADIVWAHKRWQREALAHTTTIKLSGGKIPVLHPEDLILLKLDAGGPRDIADIKELLADPPPELDLARLKQNATRLRLGEALKKCLREIK